MMGFTETIDQTFKQNENPPVGNNEGSTGSYMQQLLSDLLSRDAYANTYCELSCLMTQVSEALFLLFKGQNEHEAQNRRNVQLVNFEGSHPHEEEFAWPRIAGLENALALADLADLTTWQCFFLSSETYATTL